MQNQLEPQERKIVDMYWTFTKTKKYKKTKDEMYKYISIEKICRRMQELYQTEVDQIYFIRMMKKGYGDVKHMGDKTFFGLDARIIDSFTTCH